MGRFANVLAALLVVGALMAGAHVSVFAASQLVGL